MNSEEVCIREMHQTGQKECTIIQDFAASNGLIFLGCL